MKIDTDIRHVTRPGANIFLELGFAPEEAKRLQVASRKQITDTQVSKEHPMLQPDQFHVNEAWIAFKLNDAPISTELDGDFNLLALMDVASCFMLGTTTLSAGSAQLSQLEAKLLLKKGQSHKKQLPKKLFIPDVLLADQLVVEAARLKVDVQRIDESELQACIGETREIFRERFGGIQQ